VATLLMMVNDGKFAKTVLKIRPFGSSRVKFANWKQAGLAVTDFKHL